jgi:hypothetical protein
MITKSEFLAAARKGWETIGYARGDYWQGSNRRWACDPEDVCFACAIGAAAKALNKWVIEKAAKKAIAAWQKSLKDCTEEFCASDHYESFAPAAITAYLEAEREAGRTIAIIPAGHSYMLVKHDEPGVQYALPSPH